VAKKAKRRIVNLIELAGLLGLATPELPPGADIRDRTSAFLDFRRLYPQVRTLRIAARIVRR
jgi:hypothetical protein